jgi:TonB family protein
MTRTKNLTPPRLPQGVLFRKFDLLNPPARAKGARLEVLQLPLFLMISFGIFFSSLSAPADSTKAAFVLPADSAKQASAPKATSQSISDTIGKAPDSLPAIEKMPVLISFVKADYPADLVKKGVEGTVTLDLVVSDSGKVDSVAVVKGVEARLDSSAAHAARAFKFSPAMAGGKPTAVLMEYAYHFTIAEAAAEITPLVNLAGKLFERGTRAPIVSATVVATFPDTSADPSIKIPFSAYLKKIGNFDGQYLQERALVTTSDSTGAFSFKSLPAGPLALKVVVPDYEGFSDTVRIIHGKATDVVYRLQRIAYGDNEVVVYGKEEKKEVAQRTLTLQEVQNIPGLGGDAVKVIEALPGVARVSFFSSDIILRGSASGDTKYYLDGIMIPQLFHFGGVKSTYNSDALASVDLYPGGFNVEYGDAVGGTVEIKGRPAKTDRWHADIDMNFIDGTVLFEGPINPQLSLLTTFRRSWVADFLNFVIKKAGIVLPFTVAPYYWDDVTRLDYHPNKNTTMFLTFFTSDDEMKFIIENIRGGSSQISSAADELSQSNTFRTLLYGYDQTISASLKNSLRLAYTDMNTVQNIFAFAHDQRDIYGSYIRDQLTYAESDRLKVMGGVDASPSQAKYSVAILGVNGPIETKGQLGISDLALYVKSEYKPFEKLTLIPGARYDYYTDIRQGEPSLRLTARYDYIPGHTIKGSIGTYSQDPQPSGQAIDPVFGNPSLPPTLGTQSVLGYEYKITDLINLDVQTYYNTQTDIPEQTDSISPVTGKPYNFLPIEKGRMYGLELLLKHNQGKHFFGWIAYSLSRSLRNSPIPYSTSFNPATWDPNSWYLNSFDQTNNLQIIGSWKLPWSFEAGLRYQYTTGNPVTPNLGFTEHIARYDAETGSYDRLSGTPRADRMGPYNQLDMRISKKFTYDKWIFTSYIDVQNVNYFWYNSPSTYQYSYDGFERQTVGGIIIPSFGLKAEF